MDLTDLFKQSSRSKLVYLYGRPSSVALHLRENILPNLYMGCRPDARSVDCAASLSVLLPRGIAATQLAIVDRVPRDLAWREFVRDVLGEARERILPVWMIDNLNPHTNPQAPLLKASDLVFEVDWCFDRAGVFTPVKDSRNLFEEGPIEVTV